MALKSTWTLDPNDFMMSVRDSVKKKSIELATAVFEGVVDRSPVYTGNFRASWRMSHTTEDLSETDSGSADSPLPAPRAPRLSNVPDFPVIYVTNARPYSIKLEYGWSKQAPSGIVRTTIDSLS